MVLRNLFLLFILFSFQISAQQVDFLKDSLDSYITKGMQRWQIPGIAVAIIKDGNVVFSKGFGVKEIGKTEPINPNTLFMIGSNTKAFTATGLSLLQNEGKLNLDDRATKWLPYFKMQDVFAGNDARLRDLLCHRMGLKTFQGDFTYWESNLSRKQVIERMGKIEGPYPFRTEFGYCNAAYVTAGEVIEVASGKLWETFIYDKLLKPLAMVESVPLTADLPKTTNKASPHMRYMDSLIAIPYCQIDNLAAAGSIASSVTDMAKWIKMQLDTGKVNGAQVFPKSAILRTWEPQLNIGKQKSRFLPSQFYQYSLGWFVRDYAGKRVISHDGGVNGFLSNTTFIPELNAGFVILTNSQSNSLYNSLSLQITEALLGLPYRNFDDIFWGDANVSSKKNKERLLKELSLTEKNEGSTLPLANYAGIYSHPIYGTIWLNYNMGKLELSSPIHGILSKNIKPQGGHSFWCVFDNKTMEYSKITFDTADNQVNTMTIKVPDFVEFDPYVFKRIN